MQKSYLMTLYDLAEKDSNVLLLLADSGTTFDELFKNYLPNQILDFGIAEENMVAAAAGMASCGKIPFVYTASAFLSYRSYEFIRDDVCFQNNNVKFVGMGEGLSWSTLGPTHHTTEELSLLRGLPNLVVLSPSTPSETSECIKFAYNYYGPVYIRIGMGGEKEYYEEPHDILKNRTLKPGSDITIFVTGSIIEEVYKTTLALEDRNISVNLVDVCSISPFDKENVVENLKTKKAVISVEEHNVIGGLGSAICEVIAEEQILTPILRIGLNNKFANGYGTREEVRTQNGLDAESITEKICNWLTNRGIL